MEQTDRHNAKLCHRKCASPVPVTVPLAGPRGVGRGAAPLRSAIIAVTTLLALSACAAPVRQPPEPAPYFIEKLPAQVAAVAAPYQNLQAVRLRPEDGCYWYRHVGPVETTMLPLRTTAGNRICTQSGPASTPAE